MSDLTPTTDIPVTKANIDDIVASAFGEGNGAILVRSGADMRLLKRGLGASVESCGLVKILYNYDAARAWVGLPEDYPDPFEDA